MPARSFGLLTRGHTALGRAQTPRSGSSSSIDKRRFEDTIRFRTTRTATQVRWSDWTLSLHQAGSNAPTDWVPDADFPAVP